MTEWVTPQQRTHRNVVTPDTARTPIRRSTSNNPFAPLLIDNEAEPTERNENEEEETLVQIIMTDKDETKAKSLEDYLKAKDSAAMTPVTEPTKVDIIKFKKKLGTALTKCKTKTYKKGNHLYLLLNEEEYRIRVKDPTAKLPTRPLAPVRPVGTAATSGASLAYKEAKEEYELHMEYDQQAVDLIERKFPGGLTGLEDEEGDLPLELSAKEAMAHIEGKIVDVAEETKCYTDLLMGLLKRPYKTSADGAEEWFKQAEADRVMARYLDQPYVPYSVIMGCAQQAFRNGKYDLKDTIAIDVKWKKEKANKGYEHDTKEIYEAFKKLYKEELAILYVEHGKTKGRAYHSVNDNQDDWRTAMEHNIDQTNAEIEDLASAYSALRNTIQRGSMAGSVTGTIASAKPSTITVPTVPSNPGSSITPDHLKTIEAQLASLQAAFNAQLEEKRTQTQRRDGAPKEWRQYSNWCYTCGVNLSHGTKECRWRRREGHDSHHAATFNDPQGGSTKRNHLWMKWSSPTGEICDQRGN